MVEYEERAGSSDGLVSSACSFQSAFSCFQSLPAFITNSSLASPSFSSAIRLSQIEHRSHRNASARARASSRRRRDFFLQLSKPLTTLQHLIKHHAPSHPSSGPTSLTNDLHPTQPHRTLTVLTSQVNHNPSHIHIRSIRQLLPRRVRRQSFAHSALSLLLWFVFKPHIHLARHLI